MFVIETLHDLHLVNATVKLKASLAAKEPQPQPEEGLPNDAEVLGYLLRECEARNLSLDWENGLAPGDDRLQGAEAVKA